MGLKAPQLLDYAASLKLDTLFISDLEAFDSFDEGYLLGLRMQAESLNIQIYLGGWSICPTSRSFRNTWGTADELLRLGIRVAKTLGSPVFRVVLGAYEDRETDGGIQARIADTVSVLKSCRQDALDAGVMVAVENHAGDMHSWELVDLIEAAGSDFVGATIDSGNAAWTLEDPMDVLENLGKYVLCSGIRDEMIWDMPDGATVQWTAVGEGVIDWKAYTARWAQLCPNVPIIIETISGLDKSFAYKHDGFWQYYDKRPVALAHFEALAKPRHTLQAGISEENYSWKSPDEPEHQEFQKAELERSIRYFREVVGLAIRA
jgi:sugar phosphate isomerase/epimerase